MDPRRLLHQPHTKQIDLWMGGSYSRRSSLAKTSAHTLYDGIKVDQRRLTDKPLDKPQCPLRAKSYAPSDTKREATPFERRGMFDTKI